MPMPDSTLMRGHAVLEPDQPVGLGIRKRIQHHALHDREDRRVGPDGERERQRGGEREHRSAQQSARGLPDLISHTCHLLTFAACAIPHRSRRSSSTGFNQRARTPDL